MIYRFADFELDLANLELRCSGETRAIEPQVFDLLRYLVQNRTRVVTRDELFESVWAGRIVSDATLSSRVKAVRQALGDTGKAQRFVRTIPRRGFRFVADVAEAPGEMGSADGHKAPGASSGWDQSERSEPGSNAQTVSDQSSEAAADRRETKTQAWLARPALAVLPFENFGGVPEDEYFADGLTEDLITRLSYSRSFPVIARNSSFAYKGQPLDVRRVAAELGVRYLLEGSVRRGGERIRITAHLIDAETGHHVWAEKFDRKFEDVFELQDEITMRTAGALDPQVELAELKRSLEKTPEDLNAWDYYLRGLHYQHEFSRTGNIEARNRFHEAIRRDPGFARPHAMVSLTHGVDLVQEQTDDRQGALAACLKAAEQAIALDDQDSSAHVALSLANRWTGNYDVAVAQGWRAVELNPSNAFAYFMLGNVLDLAGHPHDGIPHVKTAQRLSPRDPRSHVYVITLARSYFNARDYEAAAACAREVQQRWSGDPRGPLVEALSLAQLGHLQAARVAFEKCEQLEPGFADKWVRNRLYRESGDQAHLVEAWRLVRGNGES